MGHGSQELSLDRDGAWWANALRAFPGRRRPVLGHLVEVDQVRGMVHAARQKNRVLAGHLLQLDMREFGDAIKGIGSRARGPARV